MAKLSTGDRVFLRDGALDRPGRRGRERLGVILGEAGPEAHHGNGHRDHVTYLVDIRGVDDPAQESPSPIPQELLEPAGDLGVRYEQIVGPFSDVETLLQEAETLNERFLRLRDIDLLIVHWPQWMPVVEIRRSRMDVPTLHMGPTWSWHLGLLKR